MDLLNVFITNLGKYNEGELVGEWVNLPVSEEELDEVFKRIGLNEEYEEYFITDFESDVGIKIGEYENIKELNEIIQELDDATNGEYDKLSAVMEKYYCDFRDMNEVIETMQSDDVDFIKGWSGADYERSWVEDCYDLGFNKLGWISNYISIDYEQMAKDDDYIYETNDGVLIDRR
jgi:RNA recognition motif-containing protein